MDYWLVPGGMTSHTPDDDPWLRLAPWIVEAGGICVHGFSSKPSIKTRDILIHNPKGAGGIFYAASRAIGPPRETNYRGWAWEVPQRFIVMRSFAIAPPLHELGITGPVRKHRRLSEEMGVRALRLLGLDA